ncbi:PQQ-binding-like beta-propeller repeat protein, partial [Salmonella enterica subsp. enterica serovar Anatum]|nr:PQQ-binding-like beta-propeller repeat protein [Salmonella enterica subsp. enterica serovar Anatum]
LNADDGKEIWSVNLGEKDGWFSRSSALLSGGVTVAGGHVYIGQLEEDIARGITALEAIIGKPVTCSAAAGWRADGRVVRAKEP